MPIEPRVISKIMPPQETPEHINPKLGSAITIATSTVGVTFILSILVGGALQKLLDVVDSFSF